VDLPEFSTWFVAWVLAWGAAAAGIAFIAFTQNVHSLTRNIVFGGTAGILIGQFLGLFLGLFVLTLVPCVIVGISIAVAVHFLASITRSSAHSGR
jgi:hypothetical protein